MDYYLGGQSRRPDGLGLVTIADVRAGGGAAGGSAATPSAELVRRSSVADLVPQDEGTEATIAQLSFLMDSAEMAETPWRQPGASLMDYFNFDLDEKRFREYFIRQVKYRLDARQRRKIGGG